MEDLNQKDVLVVGGAGFVGSNLVKMLLDQDAAHVSVVDNLLSSERNNVPDSSRVTMHVGSIADDETLSGISDQFDYVFHLGTFHGNQNSIHDPLTDHANNTLTTLKLFEHFKSFGRLKKLIYAGAGCAVAEKTYDAAEATTEEAPISIRMDSPYSISKIIGEFYACYYQRQHGLPVVRARFQNVYGPGEVLGAGQWRGTAATVWRNVTPTFIYKAIHGHALPVDGDGMTSRDFIYVDDICRGLIACALNGASGDVYNIASGKETTIRELATTINALTGSKAPIEWRARRAWDRSGRRFGSPDKAKRELGFEAQVDIAEGLRRTVAWTRENLEFIEACIAKHAHFFKAA